MESKSHFQMLSGKVYPGGVLTSILLWICAGTHLWFAQSILKRRTKIVVLPWIYFSFFKMQKIIRYGFYGQDLASVKGLSNYKKYSSQRVNKQGCWAGSSGWHVCWTVNMQTLDRTESQVGLFQVWTIFASHRRCMGQVGSWRKYNQKSQWHICY